MKRIFAVVLVFAMVLSLCGCGRTSLSNHKGMEYVCDPKIITPTFKATGSIIFLPNGEMEINVDDTLIYKTDGAQTPICENVSGVGWDGEKVLYYCKTDCTLYSWQGGKSRPVFTLEPTAVVDWIYGAKSGIVFSVGSDYFRYTYGDQRITQVQCLINEYQEAFIYEDWIISMWGDYTNFTAYNLASNETVVLDISKTLPGLDCEFTESTYATYDGRLFISLRVLEVNGWVEGVDVEGVYEIDLETMEVKVLRDKYFEELYCTEQGLYAKGKFRTIELCRFD